MPQNEKLGLLSPVGLNYLGGLLHHAIPSTLLGNPTVNAYRRFRPNSLAPDRVAWGSDHRGVMLRVLGGAGDSASRIENRVGEPAANPYLYIASQIICGMNGLENQRDPGEPDTDPYTTKHKMLPNSLGSALEAFEQEPLFTAEFGNTFTSYYTRLKRTELKRFEEHCAQNEIDPSGDAVTEWEQNEYFDFF
jgi:glutamine synthetase